MGFNKTHIVINPAYEHLRNWIVRLPEIFEHEGEIIYNDRNQIRTMKIGNQDVVVKRFRKPRFFNRIAYTIFRQPKAVRSYDNAQILQQRSINTPTPIAYIIEYSHGLIAQSYLITEKSRLTHRMYEFGEGKIDGREHILTAFAKFTATIHEAGVYHEDYSPGNILFDDNGGQIEFAIIDINRMHFGNVSMQDGCKNFSRLWATPDMMRLIATTYANKRHYDEKKCNDITLRAWRKFWKYRHPGFNIYD